MRRALFLGIPLIFFSAACSYDNGDSHRVLAPPPDCGTPVQSTIDADRQIDVTPGQGAGVFVEYASGGHWTLTTSCDTAKTNASCQWDILVTPETGRSLTNVVAADLESGDSVLPFDAAAYQLLATTSGDLDGMTFDTEPGTGIRVDALLDQACALPYFFWVGDGALHTGSPSNPLDLVPSAP